MILYHSNLSSTNDQFLRKLCSSPYIVIYACLSLSVLFILLKLGNFIYSTHFFFYQVVTVYLVLSYAFWALETIKIGSTWSLAPRILFMISLFCPKTVPELDFYREGIFVQLCVYDRVKLHEA